MSILPTHRDIEMTPRALLDAWTAACRRTAGGRLVEQCRTPEARLFVGALVLAGRRGSPTAELGRAARTWGAGFDTPVDVVAAVALLRDAMSELDPAASAPAAVFDHVTMEAVDAASANLRSEARADPLTGCANRRALQEDLPRAVASATTSGLDLSLVAVDLDGLKRINDTEGHDAGDRTLVALVKALRGALRESDGLYRTGGDEFVVVAPFTTSVGARSLMARATAQDGPPFSWGTASLADLLAAGRTPDASTLMDAADADLYERRHTTRHAVALARRRRKLSRAASLAASLAATTSVAGFVAAAALDAGPALTDGHLAAATLVRGGASAVTAGGRSVLDPTLRPASGDAAPDGSGSDLASVLGVDMPVTPGPGLAAASSAAVAASQVSLSSVTPVALAVPSLPPSATSLPLPVPQTTSTPMVSVAPSSSTGAIVPVTSAGLVNVGAADASHPNHPSDPNGGGGGGANHRNQSGRDRGGSSPPPAPHGGSGGHDHQVRRGPPPQRRH
ncbi:MAG: GGDEF domain-containing protein [Acidimicrobiales bacterium]